MDNDDEVFCVLCKAAKEDRNAAVGKGAAIGGAGLLGIGIKYRHVIKDAIITLIKR